MKVNNYIYAYKYNFQQNWNFVENKQQFQMNSPCDDNYLQI